MSHYIFQCSHIPEASVHEKVSQAFPLCTHLGYPLPIWLPFKSIYGGKKTTLRSAEGPMNFSGNHQYVGHAVEQQAQRTHS